MKNRKYTLEEQKAHRKEWVAALRSGKYKQGKYALKNKKDEYCCLGVACEVAGIKASEYPDEDTIYQFDGMIEHLDESTLNYFGIADYGFYNQNNNIQNNSLIKLNDTEGYNFDQIADVIESEPEGLFVE